MTLQEPFALNMSLPTPFSVSYMDSVYTARLSPAFFPETVSNPAYLSCKPVYGIDSTANGVRIFFAIKQNPVERLCKVVAKFFRSKQKLLSAEFSKSDFKKIYIIMIFHTKQFTDFFGQLPFRSEETRLNSSH